MLGIRISGFGCFFLVADLHCFVLCVADAFCCYVIWLCARVICLTPALMFVLLFWFTEKLINTPCCRGVRLLQGIDVLVVGGLSSVAFGFCRA